MVTPEEFAKVQQIIRRRLRAGLTAGVLYIAVGTGIGLGTILLILLVAYMLGLFR